MALPHAFARAARSRAIPANSLFMRVFRASELPALRRREKIHAPFSRFARERGGRHGRKVAGNMRKPANPHLARVCGLFSFSIRCCGCLMALSIFLSQVFSCNLARTRMITAFARLFPARHGVSRFVIYSVKLHPPPRAAVRSAHAAELKNGPPGPQNLWRVRRAVCRKHIHPPARPAGGGFVFLHGNSGAEREFTIFHCLLCII